MYPENLLSLELERKCLGGIINHPQSLVDLDNIISHKEFSNKVHILIFSVVREIILSGKKIEKSLLGQKVKDLGISYNNEISIGDYIDDISFTQVKPEGIKEIAQELVKLRIRRDLWDNTDAIQTYLRTANNDPIDKIISHIDSIYSNQINLYTGDNEPIDLYSNIEEFIKMIAKNPVEETGLKTPFPEWNKLFGGIRLGSAATNIISRAGEGKSAFLWNMGKDIARINNIKTLYIDTEMDDEIQMFRAAAAESQVNAWYLETGQWPKNAQLSDKVMQGFSKINEYKGKMHYIAAPNRDIKEIINLIRRWYFKHVGRGNKALVVYDYMKVTTDADRNRQEYQQMGDKLSYLNEITHNLKLGLMTAGQQNRSAENQGQRNDDSTTAAVSDRINQYCSFNAVFRKKLLDEISDHGIQYGSHLLKPFKTSRVQGISNYNVNSFVKVINSQTGKSTYKQNFINYEIKEYGLYEKGTYADIVKNQQLSANLQADHQNHHDDTHI